MDQLEFKLVPDFAAKWSLALFTGYASNTPCGACQTLCWELSVSPAVHIARAILASQGLDPAGSVAGRSLNGAVAHQHGQRRPNVTCHPAHKPYFLKLYAYRSDRCASAHCPRA